MTILCPMQAMIHPEHCQRPARHRRVDKGQGNFLDGCLHPSTWAVQSEHSTLESQCPMVHRSDSDSAHPAAWRKLAEFRLGTHHGCEETASQQMQQSLTALQLPVLLLPKVQTSVYNAVARVCAAQIGSAQMSGEVLLHLFVAAQAHGDSAGHPAPQGPGEAESGWGFFLIERRAADGQLDPGQHIVELYCYQEGP